MWIKILITIFIFYILAISQTSFSSQFSIAGARLNLVFILFFILIFFSSRDRPFLNWKEIFYAVVAGILLDIFSAFYLGLSIAALLIILFFNKKFLYLLKDLPAKYPLSYFAPLFCASFFIYRLFLEISFCFFNFLCAFDLLNVNFLIEMLYNLLLAVIIFYIYKKLFIKIPRHEFKQI